MDDLFKKGVKNGGARDASVASSQQNTTQSASSTSSSVSDTPADNEMPPLGGVSWREAFKDQRSVSSFEEARERLAELLKAIDRRPGESSRELEPLLQADLGYALAQLPFERLGSPLERFEALINLTATLKVIDDSPARREARNLALSPDSPPWLVEPALIGTLMHEPLRGIETAGELHTHPHLQPIVLSALCEQCRMTPGFAPALARHAPHLFDAVLEAHHEKILTGVAVMSWSPQFLKRTLERDEALGRESDWKISRNHLEQLLSPDTLTTPHAIMNAVELLGFLDAHPHRTAVASRTMGDPLIVALRHFEPDEVPVELKRAIEHRAEVEPLTRVYYVQRDLYSREILHKGDDLIRHYTLSKHDIEPLVKALEQAGVKDAEEEIRTGFLRRHSPEVIRELAEWCRTHYDPSMTVAEARSGLIAYFRQSSAIWSLPGMIAATPVEEPMRNPPMALLATAWLLGQRNESPAAAYDLGNELKSDYWASPLSISFPRYAARAFERRIRDIEDMWDALEKKAVTSNDSCAIFSTSGATPIVNRLCRETPERVAGFLRANLIAPALENGMTHDTAGRISNALRHLARYSPDHAVELAVLACESAAFRASPVAQPTVIDIAYSASRAPVARLDPSAFKGRNLVIGSTPPDLVFRDYSKPELQELREIVASDIQRYLFRPKDSEFRSDDARDETFRRLDELVTRATDHTTDGKPTHEKMNAGGVASIYDRWRRGQGSDLETLMSLEDIGFLRAADRTDQATYTVKPSPLMAMLLPRAFERVIEQRPAISTQVEEPDPRAIAREWLRIVKILDAQVMHDGVAARAQGAEQGWGTNLAQGPSDTALTKEPELVGRYEVRERHPNNHMPTAYYDTLSPGTYAHRPIQGEEAAALFRVMFRGLETMPRVREQADLFRIEIGSTVPLPPGAIPDPSTIGRTTILSPGLEKQLDGTYRLAGYSHTRGPHTIAFEYTRPLVPEPDEATIPEVRSALREALRSEGVGYSKLGAGVRRLFGLRSESEIIETTSMPFTGTKRGDLGELPDALRDAVLEAQNKPSARHAIDHLVTAVQNFYRYDLEFPENPLVKDFLTNRPHPDAKVNKYIETINAVGGGRCIEMATVLRDLAGHLGMSSLVVAAGVPHNGLLTTNGYHLYVVVPMRGAGGGIVPRFVDPTPSLRPGEAFPHGNHDRRLERAATPNTEPLEQGSWSAVASTGDRPSSHGAGSSTTERISESTASEPDDSYKPDYDRTAADELKELGFETLPLEDARTIYKLAAAAVKAWTEDVRDPARVAHHFDAGSEPPYGWWGLGSAIDNLSPTDVRRLVREALAGEFGKREEIARCLEPLEQIFERAEEIRKWSVKEFLEG